MSNVTISIGSSELKKIPNSTYVDIDYCSVTAVGIYVNGNEPSKIITDVSNRSVVAVLLDYASFKNASVEYVGTDKDCIDMVKTSKYGTVKSISTQSTTSQSTPEKPSKSKPLPTVDDTESFPSFEE